MWKIKHKTAFAFKDIDLYFILPTVDFDFEIFMEVDSSNRSSNSSCKKRIGSFNSVSYSFSGNLLLSSFGGYNYRSRSS